MSDKAIQIAEAIRKITDFRPEIGFILGSGWGKAAENLREKQTIPYADLPGMPLCGVAGHAGNFLFGEKLPCLYGEVGAEVHFGPPLAALSPRRGEKQK